jgi:hypothetical protein
MNKNKKAKIISPLIVVPLSYLGAVLIHGAHPSVGDLLWSILFVAIISLPVGYLGLFGIVLPMEEVLKKRNKLSALNLIILSSLGGGILFAILDIIYVQGHSDNTFLEIMFVFSLGFILGLHVTLSYCLLSGIISKSSLPLVFISTLFFYYLLFISPTLLKNIVEHSKHRAIKELVSNANIKELTLQSCDAGICSFSYEKTNEYVTFIVYGSNKEKRKTELTRLIFSTWPKGASHCKVLNGKVGFSPVCSIF